MENQVRYLTDDEATHVADSKGRVFLVPTEHALEIIKSVPGLRYSFEHAGGVHVARENEVFKPKSTVARPPRRR